MRSLVGGLLLFGVIGGGANAAPLGWDTVFTDNFGYFGAPQSPWEVRNVGAFGKPERV